MAILVRKLFSLIAAMSAFGVMSAAQADTWAWVYSGSNGVTASGQLSTAGNAATFEDVVSLSGNQNGVAITGLVPVTPPNTPYTYCCGFNFDNRFQAPNPNLNLYGLLFSLDDGRVVNIWYENGGYTNYDWKDGAYVTTSRGTFTVTAVPEAETFAMMLAGLGLMGAVARRRKQSQSV